MPPPTAGALTFRGIGTHGAKPHLGRDPITAAGTFLASLQTIVGRVVDPLQPAVVSACSVQAGDPKALERHSRHCRDRRYGARTIRPRCATSWKRRSAGLRTARLRMFGIAADYRFERRIPPVVNDRDATERALRAAAAVFGERTPGRSFPPSTAGDDFAFFGQDTPGCYVWLGNGPAVDGALHHNTAYDFNDEAIGPGAAFWTSLVERELGAQA